MGAWKEYILGIMVVSLGCCIILQIIPQSGKKELLHIICGVTLSVMILQPISDIRLEDYLNFEQYKPEPADPFLDMGKGAAENWKRQYITERCEAYILNKANTKGSAITTVITVDEACVPVFAEIQGSIDPELQKELERILTDDMGITKENQLWTGNPESGD